MNENQEKSQKNNKFIVFSQALAAVCLIGFGAFIPYYFLNINNSSHNSNQLIATEAISWLELKTYDYKKGLISESLNKKITSFNIKIVGYAVPLEMSTSKVMRFLLVPSRAYCIHVPPPPANLMIEVTMKEPVSVVLLQKAIVLSGKLKQSVTKTSYGYTSWQLSADKLHIYKSKQTMPGSSANPHVVQENGSTYHY